MITKQVNSLLSSENKQCISSYILQEISQSIIENWYGQLLRMLDLNNVDKKLLARYLYHQTGIN